MAIDRETSLRRAEKLLRQGRLDGAIEEYERLLEDQPSDWNTRNALGDLYVRAGRVEQAAAHFTRIADHFAEEGFLPRAIALYRKILKIKPGDEHALLQSAEVAARQGLIVDAKACLGAIAEQRRRRGDRAGANQILLRIAALDPADFAAAAQAAHAAAESGDVGAATTRYKELATELFAKDRAPEGVQALADALRLDPDDDAVRGWLVRACIQRGDIDGARTHARSVEQLATIADGLAAAGRNEAALETLSDALERDPRNTDLRARVARMQIARGDLDRALRCLADDVVGDDPSLMLLAAEVRLRAGDREGGRKTLDALAAQGAGESENIVLLGCSLADSNADSAFECIDVAADAAVAQHDWAAAAAALQELLRRVPRHIPALIRLVDVCVDGDLDEALVAAQRDLAECYLQNGRAAEARVIAEDLMMRAPGDVESVARFRRALQMLGEPDPDAIISERLADLSATDDELGGIPLDLQAPRDFSSELPVAAVEPDGNSTSSLPPPAAPAQDAGQAFSVTANPAISVETSDGIDDSEFAAPGLSDQPAEQPGTPDALEVETATDSAEAVEIDLSHALTELKAASAPWPMPSEPSQSSAGARDGAKLDEVFSEFREEVQKEQASTSAAEHYKLGLTYFEMGLLDEAARTLQLAVRSPRYRFQTASLLGRIHKERGRLDEAIDWFERAAETPATNAEAGRALLYELGQALELARESSRALAVYLELQADAGSYRDVGDRIKRLSSGQLGS